MCNNEFYSPLSAVKQGQWCPYCINKTEKIVFNKLINVYPLFEHQFKPAWCVNSATNKKLPFDFAILDKQIIIELDGKQHFKNVKNWNLFEDTQKRDIYKMKCANENNYSVIRILQEDVYNNKYDWLTELKENIYKIMNDNIVQNIFMCKKNEYDIYIKLITEDEKQRSRIESKNGLEGYTFNLKTTLENPEVKLNETDKNTVMQKITETLEWLEQNQGAEKEEYDHKQKELEQVATPIITKMYQAAGMPGGMPGGMPEQHTSSSNGPTVEEVD
jgi:very-short-patch-repair endonuclease